MTLSCIRPATTTRSSRPSARPEEPLCSLGRSRQLILYLMCVTPTQRSRGCAMTIQACTTTGWWISAPPGGGTFPGCPGGACPPVKSLGDGFDQLLFAVAVLLREFEVEPELMDAMTDRAKQHGRLRSDFEGTDIVFIQVALTGLMNRTPQVGPRSLPSLPRNCARGHARRPTTADQAPRRSPHGRGDPRHHHLTHTVVPEAPGSTVRAEQQQGPAEIAPNNRPGRRLVVLPLDALLDLHLRAGWCRLGDLAP